MQTENKETQTFEENKSTENLRQNTKSNQSSYEYKCPQCSLTNTIYNVFSNFSNFMSCRTLYQSEPKEETTGQTTHKDPEYTTDNASASAVQDWLNVPNPKN